VCWSTVVKEKSTVDSPFFRAFPSDRITKVTNMLMYISSFTAAIHVNYTSEFLGLSEATMYTTH